MKNRHDDFVLSNQDKLEIMQTYEKNYGHGGVIKVEDIAERLAEIDRLMYDTEIVITKLPNGGEVWEYIKTKKN